MKFWPFKSKQKKQEVEVVEKPSSPFDIKLYIADSDYMVSVYWLPMPTDNLEACHLMANVITTCVLGAIKEEFYIPFLVACDRFATYTNQKHVYAIIEKIITKNIEEKKKKTPVVTPLSTFKRESISQ